MFLYTGFFLLWDPGDKLIPDHLIPWLIEIPAVRLVDKDMGAVRPEPADKLGLGLDNVPVPLLAFLKCFYQFLAPGDIPEYHLDRGLAFIKKTGGHHFGIDCLPVNPQEFLFDSINSDHSIPAGHSFYPLCDDIPVCGMDKIKNLFSDKF